MHLTPLLCCLLFADAIVEIAPQASGALQPEDAPSYADVSDAVDDADNDDADDDDANDDDVDDDLGDGQWPSQNGQQKAPDYFGSNGRKWLMHFDSMSDDRQEPSDPDDDEASKIPGLPVMSIEERQIEAQVKAEMKAAGIVKRKLRAIKTTIYRHFFSVVENDGVFQIQFVKTWASSFCQLLGYSDVDVAGRCDRDSVIPPGEATDFANLNDREMKRELNESLNSQWIDAALNAMEDTESRTVPGIFRFVMDTLLSDEALSKRIIRNNAPLICRLFSQTFNPKLGRCLYAKLDVEKQEQYASESIKKAKSQQKKSTLQDIASSKGDSILSVAGLGKSPARPLSPFSYKAFQRIMRKAAKLRYYSSYSVGMMGSWTDIESANTTGIRYWRRTVDPNTRQISAYGFCEEEGLRPLGGDNEYDDDEEEEGGGNDGNEM